jgi:hypothetical protein
VPSKAELVLPAFICPGKGLFILAHYRREEKGIRADRQNFYASPEKHKKTNAPRIAALRS